MVEQKKVTSMVDSGSPSLLEPDYWWYRVRADLLERAVGRFVDDAHLVLDVGSADVVGRHHDAQHDRHSSVLGAR